MQKEALAAISSLGDQVLASGDGLLISTWGRLQSSDHPYWMSTKGGPDGEVKNYFSPYKSAEEAHRIFMRAISDLGKRVELQSHAAVGG